jgi:hypothetical protein
MRPGEVWAAALASLIVRGRGCRRIVLRARDFLREALGAQAATARLEPVGGQRRHGAAPAVGGSRFLSAVECAAAARATPAFRVARSGPAGRGGRSGNGRIHKRREETVGGRGNNATSGRSAEPAAKTWRRFRMEHATARNMRVFALQPERAPARQNDRRKAHRAPRKHVSPACCEHREGACQKRCCNAPLLYNSPLFSLVPVEPPPCPSFPTSPRSRPR